VFIRSKLRKVGSNGVAVKQSEKGEYSLRSLKYSSDRDVTQAAASRIFVVDLGGLEDG
jgi:hypothetical protein